MAKKKNSVSWTSENGKTKIEVTRIPDEGHFFSGEYKAVIYIRHDYGNYQFDGRTCSNVGEDRIYSKSDRLSYLLNRGKEYWRRHY